MGEFFNNFKRKFTAPKTRHMPKKIASIEDYLGLENTKFEQMKKDAEFYKTAQEGLHKARRALKSGDKLFEGYTVETSYPDSPDLSSAPSLFLKAILDHKCDTLQTDEEYTRDLANLTKQFGDDSKKFTAPPTKENRNLLNKTTGTNYPYAECLQILEKYEKFCRKCKQKIKDAFETEIKQFKREKAGLMQLRNLTRKFNKSADYQEILAIWTNVRHWRTDHGKPIQPLEPHDPIERVYTHTFNLAKQIVPEAIETWIAKESNSICLYMNQLKPRSVTARDKTTIQTTTTIFIGQLKTYQTFYHELSNHQIAPTLITQYEQPIENKWHDLFPDSTPLFKSTAKELSPEQ